jgi:hypothetical protein
VSSVLKLIAATLVFVAVLFFSYWMIFIQIMPDSEERLAGIAAFMSAAAVAWLAWRGMNNPGRSILETTAAGAAAVGAIGFCGGFFGPMIFTPDANQGPLLGLLITGPAGGAIGAAGGLVYSLWVRFRARYA